MTTLLAAFMTLALQAQDPAVAYREALFEEIDQAHYEKAAGLYGAVLKSDAAASLKAKALFRLGCCLDRLGKTAEAEKAFREVGERYPEEKETARRAAERLAPKGAAGATFSSIPDIDRIILDLGSDKGEIWSSASRTLVLLGDPAIAPLQRTLAHRDYLLSGRAAMILVRMEQYNGLYDTFMRFFTKSPADDGNVAFTFGLMLKASDVDRDRFVQDFPKLPAELQNRMQFLVGLEEPRLKPIFENLIAGFAESPSGFQANLRNNAVAMAWCRMADPEDAARLLRRVVKPARFPLGVVESLLIGLMARDSRGAVTPAFDEILRTGLAAMGNTAEAVEGIQSYPYRVGNEVLPSFLSAESIVKLYGDWVKSPDPKVRLMAPRLTGWIGRNAETQKRITALHCDLLKSADAPKDLKDQVAQSIDVNRVSPDLKAGLIAYNLDLIKSLEGRIKEEDVNARVAVAADALMRLLPTDSKDMQWVLGVEIRRMESWLQWRGSAPNEQAGFQEACLRAASTALLQPNVGFAHQRALEMLGDLGGVAEWSVIWEALPLIPDDCRSKAIKLAAKSLASLADAPRDRMLKAIQEMIPRLSGPVRDELTKHLVGVDQPAVDKLMEDAFKSPAASLKKYAVNHWARLKRARDLPLLMAAVKDADPDIQVAALAGIGEESPLSVVPSLIDLLESGDANVRLGAEQRLNAIKAYQGRKLEWKKWYDEVKKADK